MGIVGSRKRNTQEDFRLVRNALLTLYRPGDQIVSGGCQVGADHFAELLAQELGIDLILHLLDKSKLNPKLPYRVAYAIICYARNTQIAQGCDSPDCLRGSWLLYIDKPREYGNRTRIK